MGDLGQSTVHRWLGKKGPGNGEIWECGPEGSSGESSPGEDDQDCNQLVPKSKEKARLPFAYLESQELRLPPSVLDKRCRGKTGHWC